MYPLCRLVVLVQSRAQSASLSSPSFSAQGPQPTSTYVLVHGVTMIRTVQLEVSDGVLYAEQLGPTIHAGKRLSDRLCPLQTACLLVAIIEL